MLHSGHPFLLIFINNTSNMIRDGIDNDLLVRKQ